MSAVARIESTLGFNDAQFTNGIERAEKRAATFAGRVERSFIGIFKRDPSQRAENAVSNLIGDITSGNTAQGLAQFAGRISSLGIIAGIGIGSAIDIFSKLRASVLEVREAHDQLDKQMSKPLNLTSIEGLAAAIDNLQKKQGTFAHGFTNYLSDFAAAASGKPGAELGQAGIQDETEINAAIARRQAAERERGRNELVRANVLSGLEDDPKRKALAEMRFKFEERREAIQRSPDKGSQMRLQALDVEQNMAEKNFREGKAQRSEEFQDAQKMLALKRLNLAPDQEKRLTANLKIEQLDRQLQARNLTPENRNSLQLQRYAAKTDLRDMQPKRPENPFAFGTQANREWEDSQGGFGTIAGRNKEMNDPSVFGSLAYNKAQAGDIPLASQQSNQTDQQILAEIQKLVKAWSTE